jgi:HlyD family secretion protein
VNSARRFPWGKLIGGLLFLLVAFAVYRNLAGKEKEITYETEKVEQRTVEAHVSATGTIESTTTVTVGSQVSGPLAEVLVDFNSPVERGQVLARIDPSEFLAKVAQSQANLQSATAGLANATANLAGADAAVQTAQVGISTAQVNLQQIQGSVAAAEAGVANARAALQSRKVERENNLVQYKRSEDLVARELVALSDRDTARTSYLVSSAGVQTAEAGLQQSLAQLAQTRSQFDGARTEIRAAQARLASAVAQRDAAAAQVSAAQASVAQAQAGLQQANVELTRTTITSPISGVVIDRKVDEGQTVAASFAAPELFIIARDLSQMQVKAEVSEADIGRVVEGAPVTFTVDAYPGRKFEGSVIQVRSAPDVEEGQATSNVVVYGVLVTAANPDQVLKPGMTATVEILAEKLKDAVVLPSQALRFVPSSEKDEDDKGKGKGRGKGKRKPSATSTPASSASPSSSPSASGSPTPSATPSPGPKSKESKQDEMEPGTRKGVVWVLVKGKPEKRDIVTGISSEEDVVVVSGRIKAGEEVILSEETGEEERGRFRLSF